MKNIKQELINDILTGLVVAAAFAAVFPMDALAQDLQSAAGNADDSVVKPALHVVGLISYGLGAVMTVAGISGAKKHADNAGQNPLAPAIGKLGAGAAFLAAPTVIGMIQKTGGNTMGGSQASFGSGIQF